MSGFVELTKSNDIAVILINNPPVNALSPGVPEALSDAILEINNDPSIKAAVLMGAGRTFVAGADIKELEKISSGQRELGPGLLPLFWQIESSRKPIVAAIHGNAFGGGLELAMAAHYRIAAPDAQLGQPEVKLGFIPGAGGTQRLPRLVGVEAAAEICSSGQPISTEQAIKLGLVDAIIDKDLRDGAIEFTDTIADVAPPKTRERNDKLQNKAILDATRKKAAAKQRNLKAPLAAIDAVEAASVLPFDEGCELERKLFLKCLHSEQSKALMHIFLAEREVAKVPGIPKEMPTIPINSVAVIGAGTMGGGIAITFANAGIPVVLKEIAQGELDRGLAQIKANYANSVKRGRFTQQFVDDRLRLIQPTVDYDDCRNADMVIEAVFESMSLKKEIFSELDRGCRPGAILATNTSTLNIDEIASATSRPESVIGTHFFSPANVMRLLEIVRGRVTSKQTIATCIQLSKRIGKVGVLVGNCRGFVGNRMFHPYRREAQFLVEEGAAVEQIDSVLYNFGMAMGPLATADLVGLDVSWRIRMEHAYLRVPGIRQSVIEDHLCELGRFGQKTGAGWYKYNENRTATPDPDVSAMARQWASEAGIPQRQISDDEILDRCIYALVNEGARILEEGYALRAGDIDIIYVNGYGFPAHRGGPMWYADRIGLGKVCQRIREFQERHGKIWEPAPLLQRLADEGGTFAAFNREQTASA